VQCVVVTPGAEHSTRLEQRPAPRPGAGEVLVRTLEVGVCGTDREIHAGLVGAPPPGAQDLVLGHEVLGRVERDAHGYVRGDLVTATVRRSCGACENCAAGASDACTTGHMAERGIRLLDGFASELFVETPDKLVPVPASLHRLGVLAEPMTICERAVRHALAIGHRQPWRPRRALVLGAGAIGMLTAALLRLEGLEVVTVSREPVESERAALVGAMDCAYECSQDSEVSEIAGSVEPDVMVEATGSLDVLVAALEGGVARNGVVCVLGVDPHRRKIEIDSSVLSEQIVVGNRAIVGSVNAGSVDWAHAVRDLERIARRFPGVLDRLVGRSCDADRFADAFAFAGVKATLRFS
jgi:threonine dehydrogenase-like Zn-dependent dehydrogenase